LSKHTRLVKLRLHSPLHTQHTWEASHRYKRESQTLINAPLCGRVQMNPVCGNLEIVGNHKSK
jgi:hypothetical protein